MAKSDAPFMSINASGTLFSLLTAAKWKGRPYLRGRVIPSNPSTANQQNTRAAIGTIAKGASLVLTSYSDPAGFGSLFFQTARDGAPSGQSWISWLQKTLVSIEFGDVETAYAGESGTVQGYFQTGATGAGLTDYDPDFYHQTPHDIMTAGGQLYTLAYFAANYLTGTVQTTAAAALVGANQTAIDDFVDAVTVSNS